jgi:phage terminase large subunit GpA-like protein
MLGVALATGIGLLNIFVGAAVILLLGFSMSKHTDRKMYYSLICRNCGSHFPMDPEEKDKIRREEQEKKQKKEEQEREREALIREAELEEQQEQQEQEEDAKSE